MISFERDLFSCVGLQIFKSFFVRVDSMIVSRVVGYSGVVFCLLSILNESIVGSM